MLRSSGGRLAHRAISVRGAAGLGPPVVAPVGQQGVAGEVRTLAQRRGRQRARSLITDAPMQQNTAFVEQLSATMQSLHEQERRLRASISAFELSEHVQAN
jgi:hypothetical protein